VSEEKKPPKTEESRSGVSRLPVFVLVAGLGLAVALVILGASLAAAPAPPPTIASPGTVDEPRAVNAIMRDYRFDPTPIYFVPGETVRLNVINAGLVEHELVLGDAAVQAAWAVADAAATPPVPLATAPPASVAPHTGGLRLVLASGASAVVDYQVPPAGALQMICHLPGHAERGMVADVVLRSSQ
jgi:uncharacterized cupredoxin-like copper-binding protein